jgi:hypothetical protein
MSDEGLWPQLVSTALVGTQRRSPEATRVPASLATLVPGPIRSESDLLAAAGAVALARRAGFREIAGIGRPDPAGSDDLPLAPPAARIRLRHLLAGSVHVDLIELWLTLAIERGLGVPGRDLPSLFRLGRAHERLRGDIAAVAGPRGAWLAAQRTEWRWVVGTRAVTVDVDDERAWLEGTPADRVAYLATARRRDPAHARDLLMAAWPQEPSTERAPLLRVLATGLSPADEQFLESALDDRRKEVRTVAANLLGLLPSSAYAQRMAERALACVRIGKRALRGPELVVMPPESYDAGMKRDGIELKSPLKVGERAWWFEQIISATPPSAWSGLAKSPGELTAMPVADGWAVPLHDGWTAAAIRTRDVAWAAGLVAAGSTDPSLHRLLPPDLAVAAVRQLLNGARSTAGEISALLAACSPPWPRPLANALLADLRVQLQATKETYVPPALRALAIAVVAGLPIDAADDVSALAQSIPDRPPSLSNLLETLVNTADTRYQILQEFA